MEPTKLKITTRILRTPLQYEHDSGFRAEIYVNGKTYGLVHNAKILKLIQKLAKNQEEQDQ